MLIHADRKKPQRGKLREEGGRGQSVGVPGPCCRVLWLLPLSEKRYTLLKHALEQET